MPMRRFAKVRSGTKSNTWRLSALMTKGWPADAHPPSLRQVVARFSLSRKGIDLLVCKNVTLDQ